VVHPDYDEMRQLEGRFHRDQQAIRSVLSRIQGSIWSRRGKRPPSAISFHCRNTRQTSRRSSFILSARLARLSFATAQAVRGKV
jgi:hypothetical protein